ncbi:hypothetical protein [Acinetobacter sp. ABJ_C5_2]|uniref:hypothetical protein n=1 Tax=Acinetobacter sp. ABJ_C5_2 TaxID=3376992 RepID=UPI0037C61F78
MRNTIIDIALAEELISMRKVFTDDVIMETFGTQHQYSRFSAPLYNLEGNNVKGLSLRFETNRTQGFMKHSLGLMLREGASTNLILDLCIYPNGARSHMDRARRITIYGSHIHILNDVHKVDVDYNKITWSDCFSLFREKANVEFSSSKVIGPFEGELL